MGFMFFFFNDTATTEIYTLSLHDALPISADAELSVTVGPGVDELPRCTPSSWSAAEVLAINSRPGRTRRDRKSTRLNSSHANISYAVFCLKKKLTRVRDAYYLVRELYREH